jgi:hypothetical protein
MRAKAGILLIICLLLLVGTVGAAVGIPDTAIITSDKSYLTANGVDQCTITVSVTNTTTNPGPVVGAKVNFYVLDPALGIINFPFNVSTDTNGKATRIFYVKTKSGNADIRANVSYLSVPGVYNFTTQKIDHDKAHFAIFSHPLEGNVGANVPFNISFTDYYGNPIDQIINSGQQHTINLHVHGPTPDNCSFVGYGHDIISRSLDTNGTVSGMVKLSDGAGPNSITMDPFEEILTPVPRIITGISTEPFYIEQIFNPDSPAQVSADGASKFSIIYTLFDKFRNPVSQQEVWVNTSIAGEEQKFKSDTQGQIIITYGPRVTIGEINITAKAVSNNTVTKSKMVEFLSTAATTMVLTANPEHMPSRDVDSLITSDITATVMDVMGNPVENETVTFSLGAVGYPSGPVNETLPLSSLIAPLIVKTDENGHAKVQFIPGSFSKNSTDLNYDSTATETRTIIALWNTTSKNILVTWKNYPYLSVKTSVNPQTIAVNDTVDVTISLKADGSKLQPLPIDAVLCTDRSGSMLYDNPDRMYEVREAGKVFVDQMNVSRDYLGLVTFGWSGAISSPGINVGLQGQRNNIYSTPVTYSDWATLDRNLSNGFPAVKTSLDKIVPDGYTSMRLAIYKSVKELSSSRGRPGSVKAIILLSDGDYNYYGDPLARGTGSTNSASWYYTSYGNKDLNPDYYQFSDVSNQNMSVYAKNNGIKIYSIAFADSVSAGGRKTLRTLAESAVLADGSNGSYYEASATNIESVYKAIAIDLGNLSGVNTTMQTDFSHVNVTGVSIPGAQVYDYVYNSTASTKITWQDVPKVTNVTNQTNDWADQKLNFTIGTMKLGQTWEATFRLKVKRSGSIDVFGPGSALYFNNGAETLTLPHTFLSVVPDLNVTGFGLQTIAVSSTCPVQVQQTFILPITWTTTYIGPPNTISDEVLYISESGAHVPFYHGSYPVSGDSILTRSAQFDMRTVPPGNYSIQVISKSNLVTATSQSCDNYNYNAKGVTFIKLD